MEAVAACCDNTKRKAEMKMTEMSWNFLFRMILKI